MKYYKRVILLLAATIVLIGMTVSARNLSTLPPQVREGFAKAAGQYKEPSLLLFSREGEKTDRIPLSIIQQGDRRPLEDVLKDLRRTGKPIACENPRRTIPPPDCVICKSGRVICASKGSGKDGN
jgi:hypothetical protein